MYVKKFEADSIDEAIQAVKKELGPDAIILKTISNRGLKGTFKKSKFEITAAIKEDSYRKKAKVDSILSDNEKEIFYKSKARDITSMIDRYETPKHNAKTSDYGSLGLNRAVKSKKNESLVSKMSNTLDDFLDFNSDSNSLSPKMSSSSNSSRNLDSFFSDEDDAYHSETNSGASNNQDILIEHISNQKKKIDNLEKKIFELSQNMLLAADHKNEDSLATNQIVSLLRSLNIKESIISDLIKKATFELKDDERADYDTLYEFCLREINQSIKTEMPLFSSVNLDEESVITILISETSSGQSTMARKLAILQENVEIITYGSKESNSFAQDLYNLKVNKADSLAEIISLCRKANQQNRSIIIDVKDNHDNESCAKNLVDSIKRTFKNVEVLVTCSALHAESFNGKILAKYKTIANGAIITHMDMCLDFGAIVNVHLSNPGLPFKFFATGAAVPDDFEAATSERIVASVFNL